VGPVTLPTPKVRDSLKLKFEVLRLDRNYEIAEFDLVGFQPVINVNFMNPFY